MRKGFRFKQTILLMVIITGLLFLIQGCGGNDGGGSVIPNLTGNDKVIPGVGDISKVVVPDMMLTADNEDEYYDRLEKILNNEYSVPANAPKKAPGDPYLTAITLSKKTDEIMTLATYDLASQIAVTATLSNKNTETVLPTAWIIYSGTNALSGNVYTAPSVPGTTVFIAVYSKENINRYAIFRLKYNGLASLVLGKTTDEVQASGIYDLSVISVMAKDSNGILKNVTNDPNTKWALLSGRGTFIEANKLYTAAAVVDSSLFMVSYTENGMVQSAQFTLKVTGQTALALSRTTDEIMLVTGSDQYDLSKISVTVKYSTGLSADVTNSPSTVLSIYLGKGTLNGKVYTTIAMPETAVLKVSYTEGGITKIAYFTLKVYGLSSIVLNKTTDEITLTSIPTTYDLSALIVTAKYTNNTTQVKTSETVWTKISGTGTLAGTLYTNTSAPGTATFKASYTEAGITKIAYFTLRVVGLSLITLSPATDEVALSGTYDLMSKITVIAKNTLGQSRIIVCASDPNFSWTKNSGRGTFNGSVYTATAVAETAVFTAKYIDAGVVKTAVFRLTVKAITLPPSNPTITIDLGGGVMLEMVKIPAGTFMMGRADIVQPGLAVPLTNVTLTKDYYIGKYEVTQGQWTKIMGSNPSGFKNGDNYPVEQVSWYDITNNFIPALNAKKIVQGTFRLPTEAEWEYACRAGNSTAYYWGESMDTAYCYWLGNSNSTSHPVGQKIPNAFGLYDMSGNIWEWCSDWYGVYPGGTVTDPTGPETGSGRVYRGGSWGDIDPGHCLSAFRYGYDPSHLDATMGFRLALSLDQSQPTGFIFNPPFERQLNTASMAYAIATDSSGNVYSMGRDHTIQKFNSMGNVITQWTAPHSEIKDYRETYGIVVNSSLGYVYVTHCWNNLVQRFDLNGNFINEWGSAGSGDGQFNKPTGITIDSSGNVYVVDGGNNRIQKFDPNGNFISKFTVNFSSGSNLAVGGYIAVDSSNNIYVTNYMANNIKKFGSNGNLITQWGTSGSGNTQFNQSFGITTDSQGHVFVVDVYNRRVQVFDSNGNFLCNWVGGNGGGDFGSSYPFSMALDSSGNAYVSFHDSKILKFGQNVPPAPPTPVTQYTYEKQWTGLSYPEGIALNSDSSSFYVVEQTKHCVTQYNTASGEFIRSWGTSGSGDGQFNYPNGITVDSQGNVYVADQYNHRIQKFDSTGHMLLKIGAYGTDDGQFNNTWGVAVDLNGYIYATDVNNHRIQKFNSNGEFITKWGTYGTGNGQFNSPAGIAIDNSGNVYVTDSWNHRVQKFNSNGVYITQWGSLGTENSQFNYPWAITVDYAGNVFVAEGLYGQSYNHRVQKFDSNGLFITKWGTLGTENGQFNDLRGITVDQNGNVYVSETYNFRVQKFVPVQ